MQVFLKCDACLSAHFITYPQETTLRAEVELAEVSRLPLSRAILTFFSEPDLRGKAQEPQSSLGFSVGGWWWWCLLSPFGNQPAFFSFMK